jgi:flavin reductase (DIM6/NTAB) family NADH-FMN oxidoreductase RutF
VGGPAAPGEEAAMVGTMIEAKRALGMFPRGLYLLTARFEHKRAGQFVEFVQPCSNEPLMICVAARKGHSIEPLIRDSHCFAICRVDPEDKLLHRKFTPARTPESVGDPFDSLEVERLTTGAPVLRRSMAVLDCQVARHLDLESDHELYIGLVVGGRVYSHHV